ncbi:hypothetical protein [Chryseobacterium sp.]|uniref:hypothetical protein n=1 Tax=Chryseobacterium sp. TaxID=1871047 RepID=UPI00388F1ED1
MTKKIKHAVIPTKEESRKRFFAALHFALNDKKIKQVVISTKEEFSKKDSLLHCISL